MISSSTVKIFREEPYSRACDARVVAVNAMGGIVLDRTVFYPTGGGQPGDSGILMTATGKSVTIATTVKGRDEDGGSDVLIHVPIGGQAKLEPGLALTAEIDWDRRHQLMRVHTCLHLLSAVVPFPVTGGQVGESKGRLDFAIPENNLNKDEITAELNRLIQTDSPVGGVWITDAELTANPDLVKAMSVQPPTGAGRVRLIRIEGLDLQPCGGTHVARTGEIGSVKVTKIESKGRQNRRVAIVLNENN